MKHFPNRFRKYAFLLLFVSQVAVIKAQDINSSKINSIVEAAASSFMKDSARIGLSIGVHYKGSSYTYNYGTTEKGKAITPTENTIYEVGSITKTITGMLLAQTVFDNKVNLEDDVRKYINGSYPNLEFKGRPIKLVHLLNHSSGLPFLLPDRPELFKNADPDILPFTLSAIESNYTKQQFFEDLKKVRLDTIPGIKLSYSNSAAQLLGFILERVYNMPYEDLVIKYVARPLDMPDTKLVLTKKEKKRLAKGYNGNSTLMPYTLSGAAGGIYSTVTDMLSYAKYQLNENNPLVKLSHKPTWGSIKYYAIGLNWQMDDKENEPRRLFQSGGTAGFSSLLVIYPELNICIVLLSNESDESSQGALSSAAKEIFNRLREM